MLGLGAALMVAAAFTKVVQAQVVFAHFMVRQPITFETTGILTRVMGIRFKILIHMLKQTGLLIW